MDAVGHVESACGHIGSDEDGRVAPLEGHERVLALTLRAVAVDRRRRDAVQLQKLLERLGGALGLDEDDGPAGRPGEEF